MAAPSVAESALTEGECQNCGHRAEVPVWTFDDVDDGRGFCTQCEQIVEWEEVED